MLPDGSGLELLQHLKQNRKKENVIIISAKDSIDDKIAGLDLGADDYLAKPFHLAELVARVRSVLRRKHRDGEHTISVGNVTLFPDNFMVQVAGNTLELSRKEYDILHYFINRNGRLVSKSALAEAVWGDYIDQADNYDFIYAQMKNLRKKLADAGADIEIKAVYGAGYKLVE
jgi:DNA-binding response OmpR family regulator